MSKTEITEYTFTVKEGAPAEAGAEAPVWLMCEPRSKELSIVAGGFLSLRLAEGTTLAQAQKVAQYLRDHVTGIGHTS